MILVYLYPFDIRSRNTEVCISSDEHVMPHYSVETCRGPRHTPESRSYNDDTCRGGVQQKRELVLLIKRVLLYPREGKKTRKHSDVEVLCQNLSRVRTG